MNPASLFPRAAARQAHSPLLTTACVTRAERDLAVAACRGGQVRGLGLDQRSAEWQNSRWGAFNPCDVSELPTCPCVSEDDVIPIGGCFAGAAPEGWPQDLHDAWCAQTGAGMLGNPYCAGNPTPDVPPCLTAEQQQGLAYCNQYGFQGPNGILNALCWAAMSSQTLDDFNQRPACAPPAGPPAPPRQTTSAPPAEQPPTAPPEEPPEDQKASFAVPGLILLLVAAGGAAYYFSQRK